MQELVLVQSECHGDRYDHDIKGQELTDLKRALDEGAISKRDYDKVREKILRRD
jgi:hypothetical protein